MGHLFRCDCGFPFGDSLPATLQGQIVPWETAEQVHQRFVNDIRALLASRDAGGRDRWVRSKLPEPYPLDVDDAELIGDLVLSTYFDDARLARQCPKCGALHVDLDKKGRRRQTLTQVGTRPSRVLAVIPTDTGHD